MGIPFINVLQPYENQSYTVGDTLHIYSEISCEVSIDAINVRLVNEELVPVMPAVTVYPSQKEYDLDMEYPLSDKQLAGGKYYVLIQVFYDGTSKNKYQAIQVKELPLALREIYFLTRQNVNTTALYRIKTGESPEFLHAFPFDYRTSAIDCLHDRLYIAGTSDAVLVSYNLNNQEIEWSKSFNEDPALPFIQDIVVQDGLCFLATTEGEIRGYGLNGELDYIAYTPLPRYPSKILGGSGWMLSGVVSKSGPETSLYHFKYPGGLLFYQYQTDFRIQSMFALQDNSVVLVGGIGNDSRAAIYYPQNQLYSFLYTFYDLNIFAGCVSAEETFVFATNTGLRHWNVHTGQMTLFQNAVDVRDVKFEKLSNQLYVVQPNQCRWYSWPGMGVLGTIPFTDTIHSIQFRYSK